MTRRNEMETNWRRFLENPFTTNPPPSPRHQIRVDSIQLLAFCFSYLFCIRFYSAFIFSDCLENLLGKSHITSSLSLFYCYVAPVSRISLIPCTSLRFNFSRHSMRFPPISQKGQNNGWKSKKYCYGKIMENISLPPSAYRPLHDSYHIRRWSELREELELHQIC